MQIPNRLILLAELIRHADVGQFNLAHPPEHELAWRREIGPLFREIETRVVPGYFTSLGWYALDAIIDASQILTEAIPSYERRLGTRLIVTRPSTECTDSIRVILEWLPDGWAVISAESPTSVPAVDLAVIIQIPSGAMFRVVRRSRHARGEFWHDLRSLTFADALEVE